MKLSETDRIAYREYIKRLHDIASEAHTKMADAEELIQKGIKKGEDNKEIEAVLGFYEIGISAENIAKALKIKKEKVNAIIEKHRK